jgi:hypothetical protein
MRALPCHTRCAVLAWLSRFARRLWPRFLVFFLFSRRPHGPYREEVACHDPTGTAHVVPSSVLPGYGNVSAGSPAFWRSILAIEELAVWGVELSVMATMLLANGIFAAYEIALRLRQARQLAQLRLATAGVVPPGPWSILPGDGPWR